MIGGIPLLIIVFLLVALVHWQVTGKKILLWPAVGAVCLFVGVIFFQHRLNKDVLILNQTVVAVSEGAHGDYVEISFRLKDNSERNIYAKIEWIDKNKTVVELDFKKVDSHYFPVDSERDGNTIYSVKVPWPEHQSSLNIEFAGKLIGEWSRKK